jgi:hypothetical protein
MAPGGGEPARMKDLWALVLHSWEAAKREGRPRWVGSSYAALGPKAQEQVEEYIRTMYAFDPALALRRLRSIPTTPAAVRDVIGDQAAMGVDEFVIRPCSADPAFPDLLAEALTDLPDATAT